jgi:spermidine synthase
MSSRWLFLVAYACSGLAGLVYEVTWTRLATLYMGHTTAAASTVVAAFMGGLAGGSAIGGYVAVRLAPKQALFAYAALESVVVVVALLLPWELTALTPLLRWGYAAGAPGFLFASVRLVSCLALFTIPSLALGATFPMAVRWFVIRSEAVGRLAGTLYAANTIGAAIGAVAAGFLLLPVLGLFNTVLVGIGASVLAFVCAMSVWIRSRREDRPSDPAGADPAAGAKAPALRSGERPLVAQALTPAKGRRQPAPRQGASGRGRAVREVPVQPHNWWLAAAVLGLTGFATLTFEIAWTRVFALTTGPSTYAFAATLATMIAGIAIGSVIGSAMAGRTESTVLILTLVLSATAAAAAWASSMAGGALPRAFADTLARAPQDFSSLQWQRTWLMAALIGPTAIGLGIAFPMVLQLAGGDEGRTARRLGAIYALNTLCAVIGSLATGFVTIPLLGLQHTLSMATAALTAGALLVVALGTLSARARAAAALPAVALLPWLAFQPPWDRELLASGVYKYAPLVSGSIDVEAALKAGTLVYYRDGAAASVSVKRLTGALSLSIDGKVDASTAGDMMTQKTLAHLPLLLHARPDRVCIVGLGSGVTLASALLHPTRSVDVVEISPEVVEASRLFADENRHALEDSRAHLILGDGRTHVLLTGQHYDVIISEPSNPWMAGVAALFTREFLLATRARLAPGGILCQWAHTYNISDPDLRSIIATFASVFPDGTMWLMGDGDLLLVGSTGADPLRLDNLARHWDRPGVAADLRAVSAYEPFALLSSYIGGPAEIRRYAAGAPVQSDDAMALEFSGPRALYGVAAEENATKLRRLLDRTHAPAPVAAAWADAGTIQLRQRAEMMLKANAYETAYQDYVSALALDAMDPDAPDGLARAAVAAHREPDAVTQLESAVRSHPRAVRVRIALSKLHAATGSLDRALAAAKDACTIEPIENAALEQLASLYSDVGDPVGLDGVAEALRRFFPHSRGASYYTAASQFLHEDRAAAERSVQLAIAADSGFAPAHNLAGAIQASQGNAEQARAAFRTALRLDPRDPVTYTNLARLELSVGQATASAGLFAEALSLDPSSSSARRGLADAQRAIRGR